MNSDLYSSVGEGRLCLTRSGFNRRIISTDSPTLHLIDRALIDNHEIYYKSAAEFKQALLNTIP